MANGKEANAITSKCSVCGVKFANVQECFKHELIKHSLQKKSSPHNYLQKRLNATAKLLNAEEKLMERKRLNMQLKKCKSGQELRIIFEMFCMKTDNLDLIFTRIQTCLEKELRSAGIVRIYPFGSIASGLALRDCDIDIFVDVSGIHTSPTPKKYEQNNSEDTHQRKAYNRINGLLQRSQQFTDVYAIRKARVPIIKCKHKNTGFSIDINVSYPSSRENTQFIYDLVKSDQRIHEMMLFLKLWAKHVQIIGRENMTSYCLVTMIIFFLQQPRDSEGQTRDDDTRILKSMKELQQNCPFRMVQGVNYAYDLRSKENKPKIPANVTSWDLVKGFFNYYHNFNFEDYIISPYYGKSVAKTDLTPDLCDEYNKQLRTITQYMQGEQPNNFQIDRCLCVQDAFCLNQNTAKAITSQNREYIVLCLQNGQSICENPENLKLAGLYQQLLFQNININSNKSQESTKSKLVTDLKNLKLPTSDTYEASTSETCLVYTILPSKADLRAVSCHHPDIVAGEDILRSWCQHYVDLVADIMTKLYRIDVQKPSPTQKKQQKLDKEETDEELNQTWPIHCTIDLWSNRCFQKALRTSFMSYQLEQTERLHSLRRQDPTFSVNLNGIFKLIMLPNYGGIKVQIELAEGAPANSLGKKGPLRKFFNVFKNTLQNCNLKESLDNATTSNIQNSDDSATGTATTAVS